MVSLKRKMSTLIGNILSNPWNYNFQTKPKNPGTTSVGQQRHAIKSRTLPILLTLLTLLCILLFLLKRTTSGTPSSTRDFSNEALADYRNGQTKAWNWVATPTLVMEWQNQVYPSSIGISKRMQKLMENQYKYVELVENIHSTHIEFDSF